MDASVRDLLRSLRTAVSAESACEAIDRWVVARDGSRLREASVALRDPSVEAPEWAVGAVWDHLVSKLALTPDLDFALMLRELARRGDAPYLASVVASGQTFHVVEQLFAETRPSDDEFLACLTQELVLRNGQAEREPFASFRARLRALRHPLGWLPLHLVQIEGGVELPRYHDYGMSLSIPFGPMHDDEGQPDTAFAALIGSEITSTAETRLCSTAFQDWIEHSNGKVEARFFELRAAPEVVPLADELRATSLGCLAGATDLRVVGASARGGPRDR